MMPVRSAPRRQGQRLTAVREIPTPPWVSPPYRAFSLAMSRCPMRRRAIAGGVVEQVGRDEPDDFELEAIGVVAVQALRRAVVGAATERIRLRECLRHPFEFVEGVDLPGQVVQPDRRSAGTGSARRGADLEQPEVVVVGRAGRLQEGGATKPVGRHVDPTKAQDVGVEPHRRVDVAHVQDRVIQPEDSHSHKPTPHDHRAAVRAPRRRARRAIRRPSSSHRRVRPSRPEPTKRDRTARCRTRQTSPR